MHTRSGLDASPVKGESPSSTDEEAGDGRGCGRVRVAARKVCSSRARAGLSTSKAPNMKAGQSSSTKVRSNITMKKSSMKKVLKQQGNIALKLKGKGNGDAEFVTRFSVHRIRDHKFSQEQIGWIEDASFGSLLTISEFSIPVKLVAWIMKHVDVELREFRLKHKVFVLDKHVCNVLGVPSGEEPVMLTGSADQYEAFQKIREPFMEGFKGKWFKCMEVLTNPKDKDSFMRAFMLLALGSVLCPNTDNATTLRYLYNLQDVSKIKSFDWAGHILDELMNQVQKFQKHDPDAEGASSSIYLGSCLAVLAIAYMDYLAIPADRATHKINYSIPRICHVTNDDFKFIEKVDRSRLQLHAFGKQPSLSEEYQVLLAQHNSLVEKDFDELAQSMKEQGKAIMAKRGAELASKLMDLNKCLNDVTDLSSKMSQAKKPSNDNANVYPAPDFTFSPTESPKKPSIPLQSIGHASTSSAAIIPEESTKTPVYSPPPIEPDESAKGPVVSPPPITQEESTKGPVASPPPIPPEASTKAPVSSPPPIPPKDSKRGAVPCKPSVPSYVDDIPSFDLFQPDEPEYEDVCVERSRSPTPTPTRDPIIEASKERQTGSSTIDKRNRKKRKRIDVGLGQKQRRHKSDDDDTKEMWIKFLAKRAFDQGFKIKGQCQPPPFIEINGFHITYDEFYDSFKARGLVGNNIMSLWSYQFNLDHLQLYEEKKTRDIKFAFPQLATDFMSIDPSSFYHEETCKKLYTQINEKWTITKMDLMFFPLVFEHHWVLVCVSMFMKQIAFFDSLIDSKESTCLKRAKNFIENFAATTMKHGVLRTDVSHFEWTYPIAPKQKNLFDCGLYTMDYMDAWDGKKLVDSSLEKGSVLEYRKHAAALLLLSQHNVVKLDDFVKNYESKET